MPFAAFHDTRTVLDAHYLAEQSARAHLEALRRDLNRARATAANLRRDLAATEARIGRLSRELGDHLATVTAAGWVA